ncbi:cytochrome P450 4C1-like, partial [Diabrotica undecimpunctata]|uniref:cytochrome P450 4C1-like n=1 Tax=Diabrotica undecimpunctata TaxID=50387 RepID=UPI003B634749
KVYEEAVAVLGQDGGVTDSNLSLLKYTERVIKETLRLFPPALIFSRLVTKDLDLGDVVLPEGSSATIMPLFVQRNSDYWHEPLKFDPDRFLPEKLSTRHPCTFIPFSFGPRNCIGHQFGMMSLKTVIAITVRQFHVLTGYKTVEDIDLTFGPVFSFALGDKIRFERRIEKEK